MSKVYHRKARKDYPDQGITKGDLYYFCQIKTGPRSSEIIRQLTPISRSQQTTSEYLSALYALQDEDHDFSTPEAIDSVAGSLREIGEAQAERLEEMPESLREGDTGQMMQERVQACESAAWELEGTADELDALEEPGDFDPSDYAEEMSELDPDDVAEFLNDKEQERDDDRDQFESDRDALIESANDTLQEVG